MTRSGWSSAGKSFTALLLGELVVGMEKAVLRTRYQHLFQGEAGVLESGPIRIKQGPVPLEDDDGLRDGIDEAEQLLLNRLELVY